MISRTIQTPSGEIQVNGFCDPAFAGVLAQFELNFRARKEVGASVFVTQGGKTVVNLWGGVANAETRDPWTRDTLALVWSSTKGATAICMHVLASRGMLDLDAPVANYWPENGKEQKENTRVKMFLNHTAGLPHLKETMPEGSCFNPEVLTKMLEEGELWWEPGADQGYHSLLFGWLNGEIIKRVTGKTVGQFLQEEISGPLGVDFWIGLPDEHHSRVAAMIFPEQPDPPNDFFASVATDPEGLQAKIVTNDGGYTAGAFQSPEAFRAEIPAAGGIANARGMASIYAPQACGGSLGDLELVDADSLARMGAVASATQLDKSLLIPTRFSEVFMKAIDNRKGKPHNLDSLLMSEDAFGHPGYGGSFGMADPVAEMSFGYCMNKMGPGTTLNERGQGLLDATYRALGYRSCASGRWTM